MEHSASLAAAQWSRKVRAGDASGNGVSTGGRTQVGVAYWPCEAWLSRAVWSYLATGLLVITFWLSIVALTFMDHPPAGDRSGPPVPAIAPVAVNAEADDEKKAWRSP